MKLYSGPVSLFTSKVRIALAEKGLRYERIEVGWNRTDAYVPHHPDVVALNPRGQVPVLVDDEIVVCDSTLILEYLDERYPEHPLYPRGLDERVRCRQLEAHADEVIFPHVWSLIEKNVYGGEEDSVFQSACASLNELFTELDKQLSGRETFCSGFTVADIAVFVVASAASTLGSPIDPGLTNFAGWMARVADRPAVKHEMAEMVAFFMSH